MTKRIKLNQEKIIEDYNLGMNIIPLANKYKIDRKNISDFIKSYYNWDRLPSRSKLNTYFDIIDNNNKAYILGFIAADGALVKSKYGNYYTLTITVKYTDRQILHFIKNEIHPKANLMEIKRKCAFNPNKEIHHIRFAYTNQNIIKALFNLGIMNNKSLTMDNIILNIPKEFRKAFIIGYLDGDGCVVLPTQQGSKFVKKENKTIFYPNYTINVEFRGTIPFLQGILDELDIKANPHQYGNIGSLKISKKQDIVKIFKCYDGLTFFLKRKYNKFLERINHPSYDIYKQAQTISSPLN